MLNVNTIEFNGEKAVINSYDPATSALEAGMISQVAEWKSRFPNAEIKTESMSLDDTVSLVQYGSANRPLSWIGSYCHAWMIGEFSQRIDDHECTGDSCICLEPEYGAFA